MTMMRQKFALIGAIAVSSVLMALPAMAQDVNYIGTLRIGFGDTDQGTDHTSNNAVPVCAATNVFAPQTFGTLDVYGLAANGPTGGKGSPLTFSGHGIGGGPQAGSGRGGAEVKVNATCNVSIPPFANPRLRSRIQVGAAKWPGVRGGFQLTANGNTGANPQTTPTTTPTYMIGANLGNASAFDISIPFYPPGLGGVSVVPGTQNYGGGIPFQGGGGVQLGLNTTTMTTAGMALMTFGLVPYVNGFLPTDPQLFGTDAKGVYNGASATNAISDGLIIGQANAMSLRSPGRIPPLFTLPATTINQQGFVVTTGMGVTATGAGAPLQSPAQFDGAFFEWTTGMVQHTDAAGDFPTARTATGYDRDGANLTGSLPLGTTRQLQLVSPWSASIALTGIFAFPVPDLGFGGLAELTLDIIPSPEPGSMALIGFGVAGLMGLGAMRRRN